MSDRSTPAHSTETGENSENIGVVERSLAETLLENRNAESKKILKERSQNVKQSMESKHDGVSVKLGHTGLGSMQEEHIGKSGSRSTSKRQVDSKGESDEPRMFAGDDTVVVKFVDKAIVGKSETEDAFHHGLVDPTINMKEAMNAINNMFKEPLDIAPRGRRSRGIQKKEDQRLENGFVVFVDDNLDKGIESIERKEEKGVSLMQHGGTENFLPQKEPFTIFVDDEESNKIEVRNDDEGNLELNEVQIETQGFSSSSTHVSGFVFPSPKDLPSESSDEQDAGGSPQVKLREDTVVHRFVGSTILDEPDVENVCHHGLVDPTINLKEAMADINNMFGKPIDFVRAKRPKKQEKAPVKNQDPGGFLILADDDLKPQCQASSKSSKKKGDCNLFEPTMFTKEAMDDINKMFGMPLDF